MRSSCAFSLHNFFVLFPLSVFVVATSVSGDEPPGKKAPAAKHPFVFQDVGEGAGLFPDVAGIQGHAAGWGDVDGDGFIDLYVATFHKKDGKCNQFFHNVDGKKFRLDNKAKREELRISCRASAALFADLDNDGDLDLYISSMPSPKEKLAGCTLLRNDGNGEFTNISKDNGACPAVFGGRSAAVLDYDGDGLLDLLVGEDPFFSEKGTPKTKSSRLFHNKGDLQFEDVSRAVGIPAKIPGLGVAAGDLNNDGWPDIFLACQDGGNVLFINDGQGKFREPPGSRKIFAWEDSGSENMICGVCFADINRDGLLDIAIGQHYGAAWLEPTPVRLYLNRGIKNGNPTFEDVTKAVGLKPLPMKAPHIEIQDFDNDGWPDIYVSLVKFADGKPYPVIFKNLGIQDGLPRFREDALAVNDYPNAADLKIKGSTEFFKKMVQEKKVMYTAPGPSGDFDNDGKLDLFLANWWIDSPSILLHNETPGGKWLQVQMQCDKGVNRMGIGAKVKVYAGGKMGQAAALLGCRDISAGYGYASGQPAIAHFGLGKEESVDVEVILPHGKGTIKQEGVKANQRLTIKN